MPEKATTEPSSEPSGMLPERAHIEELEKALSQEKKLADDYLSSLKYLQADFENYKRRINRETPLISEAGVRRMTIELLVVLDELECALSAGRTSKGNEAIVEGVELIEKKLVSILEKEGLTKIEAVGKKFDPNRHEAMMQVKSNDQADGTIVEEIRAGYSFKGQVIRPSLVKVTTRKESEYK
ncbi:nucleotide exchange factor GrpE [Candidatus Bathyarchaeota archaeon]|nr:nucleotide exchange factor GrpE [Candidatus Bathyarchaeota archaeon]